MNPTPPPLIDPHLAQSNHDSTPVFLGADVADPGQAAPKPKSNLGKKASWLATAAAFVAAKAKAVLFALYAAVKFLKIGKVLLTSGTMLLSIFLYSRAFGWSFAIGFVLCIFVHEMGHVFVGWKQKLPMSAPVFIPFMGAVIFNKRGADSAWGQAIMGIGGPIGGTIAGLICWAVYYATGNPFFAALAYVTFFMNLFNLTPIVPLDGGWITLAVSPYLWLGGIVVLIAMLFTGRLTNPLIFILILMSAPRLWYGLRTGRVDVGGMKPATAQQKLIMGASYLALGGFLFWGMYATRLLLPIPS